MTELSDKISDKIYDYSKIGLNYIDRKTSSTLQFGFNAVDDFTEFLTKKDILDKINILWDVLHAVDDNPNVIRLWEDHGIPTTKIGTWDGDKS